MKKISVSAPGRICLFGEHQDYLNLPVIPMAINLRVQIIAEPRNDKIFYISLPDVGKTEILDFSHNEEFEYTAKRDYFKSVFNVLFRKGVRFEHGYNCTISGNIPINSGTSSSSALNNVWCRFLLEIGQNVQNIWKENEQVGYLTYQAEAVEFSESGGMMDQISTAIGNLSFIDFSKNNFVTSINTELSTFILGDSLEPKNTEKILSQTKMPAISAQKKILKEGFEFSFQNSSFGELPKFKNILSEREYTVLKGMIKNRDITFAAFEFLKNKSLNHKKIGELLSEHHYYLDKYLGISTPKINKMLKVAIDAGAYGGKINGSGGGGCMFVYAPENQEKIMDAIRKVGGKAYLIKMDDGLRVLNIE